MRVIVESDKTGANRWTPESIVAKLNAYGCGLELCKHNTERAQRISNRDCEAIIKEGESRDKILSFILKMKLARGEKIRPKSETHEQRIRALLSLPDKTTRHGTQFNTKPLKNED